MTYGELKHKETGLEASLYSALDARDMVLGTGSSILLYVADMLVTRIQEELCDVRGAIGDLKRQASTPR